MSKKYQKQEILGGLGAREFRRLETLGDPRAKDDPKFLGQANPALKLLTANLYQQKVVSLPLDQATFDSLFPCNMNVFAQTQPDVVTNIADDATIDCQFLLTGVGVMVTLPSRSYTMPGIMVPAGDGTTPTPCNTGCTTSASQTNAALAYGYPARMAMEAFLASRRVQMYLCRRFQVFDEAARDMGLVTTLAEFIGASSSLYSVMPDVARTNDVLTARGCTKQFIPQNAVSGTSGSQCLGAPLAAVTYGSTRMLGVGQKFYRLNTPVLYTQGMKLDFRFICEDGSDCFQQELQDQLTIDCSTPDRPSSTFTSTLACGVGGAGVFTVPGGCFQFGLVLAGYDIAPACVLEYYNGLPQDSPVAAAYREAGGSVGQNIMAILAQNPKLRSQLGGLPNIEKWLQG